MKNKFLVFSLLFVFGLLILSYPQVSLAYGQKANASTGDSVALSLTIEETTATASGTVTHTGNDANVGGSGFAWGTVSGTYIATSSKFDQSYTTSSDFSWEISAGGTACIGTCTLSEGTLYYYKAYASSTGGTGYSRVERSLLTKPDEPTGLASTEVTKDSVTISWTAGDGNEKTMIRLKESSYPSSVTDGSQAYWGSGTSHIVTSLAAETTYYLRAWSSTSDGGYTQRSDTYSEATVKTGAVPATGTGGKTAVAPTTYADSLIINEGAATTQTREITLSLKAGNARLMAVSHDDLFLVPLETYTTTKTWTLTEGDGVKTVYVKFVSPDGVNSGVISDTITLETPVEVIVEEEVVEEEVFEEEVVEEEVVEEKVVEEEVVERPISEMTISEIKTKIAEIMAQVEMLQAQLTELEQEELITGCTITSFTRDLKKGMTGEDVKCLQIILNSDLDTQLAKSGVGSPSQETTYFGSLTKTAVIKFQEKYYDDVLAPWGFTKGTGLVARTTRAKLNEIVGK